MRKCCANVDFQNSFAYSVTAPCNCPVGVQNRHVSTPSHSQSVTRTTGSDSWWPHSCKVATGSAWRMLPAKRWCLSGCQAIRPIHWANWCIPHRQPCSRSTRGNLSSNLLPSNVSVDARPGRAKLLLGQGQFGWGHCDEGGKGKHKRQTFNGLYFQVLVSLQSLGKAVGLMGTNCVYWMKAPDGQTVLGHVRPKLVVKSNTLIIKFMCANFKVIYKILMFRSTQKDVQLRASMLGVALLLLINEVYPQLRTILTESMQQQQAGQSGGGYDI